MKVTILERFTSTGKILEADRKNLPDGILCKAKYQICSMGEKNRNNRVYERAVWERVLADQDIKEKLKNRSLFFHAEHPTTTQSNTEKVAGIVSGIDMDAKKVYAIMEVLDTPYGRIVDTLLKANCGIGVSTRADGELEECMDESGNKYSRVIPESYKFVTVDFTADPSSYGSEMPIEVQRGVAGVVKKGIDSESIDREYATVLLEHMSVSEAKTILESMKIDKHHKGCKCKPTEKKCTACPHVNEKFSIGDLVYYKGKKWEIADHLKGTYALWAPNKEHKPEHDGWVPEDQLSKVDEVREAKAGTEVKMEEFPSCDFCAQAGKEAEAHYDGRTSLGPWANMCDAHFKQYGVGLGTGKGQKFIKEGQGENIYDGAVTVAKKLILKGYETKHGYDEFAIRDHLIAKFSISREEAQGAVEDAARQLEAGEQPNFESKRKKKVVLKEGFSDAAWDRMIADPEAKEFVRMHSQILNGGFLQLYDNERAESMADMNYLAKNAMRFVAKYAPSFNGAYTSIMRQYLAQQAPFYKDKYGERQENDETLDVWDTIDSQYYDMYEKMEDEIEKNYGVVESKKQVNEVIKKVGDKWQVQSHKGRNLGTYDTEAEAKKRLGQVEFFKHKVHEEVDASSVSDEEAKKKLAGAMDQASAMAQNAQGTTRVTENGRFKKWTEEAQKYYSYMKIVPDKEDIYDYLAGALSDEAGISYEQAMQSVEAELGKLEETTMKYRIERDLHAIAASHGMSDRFMVVDMFNKVMARNLTKQEAEQKLKDLQQVKEDDDLSKEHPGAYCDKCGKTATEGEYSKGECKCGGNIVAESAEIIVLKKLFEGKSPKELVQVAKDYYKEVTSQGGKKEPMTRKEAIKHIALVMNRSEDEVKDMLKEDVQMILPSEGQVNQYLSDNWGQFLSEQDAVNNLIRTFKITDAKAKAYVDTASKGKGKIAATYEIETKLRSEKQRIIENYSRDAIEFSQKIEALENQLAEMHKENAKAELSLVEVVRIKEEKSRLVEELNKKLADWETSHKHLVESHQKEVEAYDTKIKKLTEANEKALLKMYTETKIKCMGLRLSEQCLTILGLCKTPVEVDETIRQYQNAFTESALHFSDLKGIEVTETVQTDPIQAGIDNKVEKAMSAWVGKPQTK